MTRAHRKSHLLIWLFLAPAIIALLILALLHRPDAPVNEALPDILIEEPR